MNIKSIYENPSTLAKTHCVQPIVSKTLTNDTSYYENAEYVAPFHFYFRMFELVVSVENFTKQLLNSINHTSCEVLLIISSSPKQKYKYAYQYFYI